MKVLYVCPQSQLGGAEQVTLTLCQGHHRARYEPVLYFLSEGPFVEQVRAQGLRAHVWSGPRPRLRDPLSLLQVSRDIARVGREEKISLLHGVMGYGHVFSGLAAKLSGIPETWFQHGPTGSLDWLFARIPTQALLVNSRHTLQAEKRFYPAARRLRVITLGTASAAADATTRTEGGDASDAGVVFALIARVSPMKGHPVFLKAAAQIAALDPRARFLVIGETYMSQDPAYRAGLTALVRELKLQDRVRFTGFLPQAQAFAQCDVIVNASVTPEPFGLSVIEGMAAGKAVIAPRAGGPAEIIRDGETGLLFSPNQASDLARAMQSLLESPARRREIGAAARVEARTRFSIGQMVDAIEAVYDEVLVSL